MTVDEARRRFMPLLDEARKKIGDRLKPRSDASHPDFRTTVAEVAAKAYEIGWRDAKEQYEEKSNGV